MMLFSSDVEVLNGPPLEEVEDVVRFRVVMIGVLFEMLMLVVLFVELCEDDKCSLSVVVVVCVFK